MACHDVEQMLVTLVVYISTGAFFLLDEREPLAHHTCTGPHDYRMVRGNGASFFFHHHQLPDCCTPVDYAFSLRILWTAHPHLRPDGRVDTANRVRGLLSLRDLPRVILRNIVVAWIAVAGIFEPFEVGG